jgi:hypothetical protein
VEAENKRADKDVLNNVKVCLVLEGSRAADLSIFGIDIYFL